jgi:hypothetical protein
VSGVSGSLAKHRRLLETLRLAEAGDEHDDGLDRHRRLSQLTRREEEFRKDAERLTELQERLESIQRERAIREQRRLDRAEGKRRWNASVTIQRVFQRHLHHRRLKAADAVLAFLRAALAVRAVNVGAWASRTMARFATICKERYVARKRRARAQAQAALSRLGRQIVIEHSVQTALDRAVQSVAAALLRLEQDRRSFFITQDCCATTVTATSCTSQDVTPSSVAEKTLTTKHDKASAYSSRKVVISAALETNEEESSAGSSQKDYESRLQDLTVARRVSVAETLRRNSELRRGRAKADEAAAAESVTARMTREVSKVAVRLIVEEQRENARRVAALREERERKQRASEQRRRVEEEGRQREGKLMFAEDLRLRSAPWRRRPSQAVSSSAVSGAGAPSQVVPSVDKIQQQKKPPVFRQPGRVVDLVRDSARVAFLFCFVLFSSLLLHGLGCSYTIKRSRAQAAGGGAC